MAGSPGLNTAAAAILTRLAAAADALGVRVAVHGHGATVIDAGVEVPGSLAAGLLFAEAALGGLGQVTFTPVEVLPGLSLPGVFTAVSRPPVACLGSQYAGWHVRIGEFSAMGSGPARALARVEELFARWPMAEQAEVAVLLLESRQLPDEAATAAIAAACGVAPARLMVAVAPTASVVGAVQVAARSVEAVLHKMVLVEFPVDAVVAGCGVAPVAPVAADDAQALGWVNDCLLYGATVWLTVDAPDDVVARVTPLLPASASPHAGRPFAEMLRAAGEFYRIDPLAFGVAAVVLANRRSGRIHRAGAPNPTVLRASLLGGP